MHNVPPRVISCAPTRMRCPFDIVYLVIIMEEHKLHAVRFVSYNFQAIQCLSFSSDGCRLALSRKDGSIEVWSVRQGIFTKIIWIPGRTNTSIEAIQWCNQRLFTGCLSGMLIVSAVGSLKIGG